MADTLDVYLYGAPAATFTYLGPSRYRLNYLPEWTDSEFAVPLSLSLPLTTRSHEGVTLTDFIDRIGAASPVLQIRVRRCPSS